MAKENDAFDNRFKVLLTGDRLFFCSELLDMIHVALIFLSSLSKMYTSIMYQVVSMRYDSQTYPNRIWSFLQDVCFQWATNHSDDMLGRNDSTSWCIGSTSRDGNILNAVYLSLHLSMDLSGLRTKGNVERKHHMLIWSWHIIPWLFELSLSAQLTHMRKLLVESEPDMPDSMSVQRRG
jgi:hypothetical protein